MNNYIPSDEEMGGLARALASMSPDETWEDKTVSDDEYRASKEWEADDLIQTPEFQRIIRTAQAEALRAASQEAGQGFDLNPPISTLNGQNAFYWYDYLHRHDAHWRASLMSMAKKIDKR